MLRRIWNILREEGPRALWFRLASVLGYRRLLLLERSLAAPIDAKAVPADYTLDFASIDDLAALLTLRPDQSEESIATRLDSGHTCLMARVGDRVASANWACQGRAPIPYLGSALDLEPDEVWLDDAWTAPDHRSRGLTHALTLHMLAHFKEVGLRRALSGILPERPLWSETGFRAYGRLASLQIGSWSHHWQRDLKP